MDESNGDRPSAGAIVVAAPQNALPCLTARRRARPGDPWRRIVARAIKTFLDNDNWRPAGIGGVSAVDVHV